jgi:hypothetical protein
MLLLLEFKMERQHVQNILHYNPYSTRWKYHVHHTVWFHVQIHVITKNLISYYGVQAPWGIYPTNLIQQQGQQTPQGLSSQQQQQQIIRSQSGRPLTPSQQNDNVSSQPLIIRGSQNLCDILTWDKIIFIKNLPSDNFIILIINKGVTSL